MRPTLASLALLAALVATGCPPADASKKPELGTEDGAEPAEPAMGPLVDALPADGTPKKGGTFTYGRGQDCVTLDPADMTDGESVKVAECLFDGLVRYKAGSTEVEPALATAWEVAPDGLSWTFTLREGVKFQDGTPLDAEAVVYTFERQRDPKHEAHGDGEYVYWHDQFSGVAKAEVAGPGKVKFTLERPFTPFLSNMAMFTAFIISPTAMKKSLGQKPAPVPVGTGPFKLVEWRRGEAVVLEANEGYWGGRPHLDRLVFQTITDNTTRLKKLEKGELHGADGLNPIDVAALAKDPDVRVLGLAGMNVGYLALNTKQKPFDDPRVREAVALCLDLDRVASKLYHGLAIPARNPLPPTLWGHANGVAKRAVDRERAKKLLADAGVPGLKTELWTMTNPRPYMPEPDKVAQYIKAALAPAGIEVTVVPKEWSSYLQEIQTGKHPMCLMGWSGDNGDPDNFLYVLLDKENTTPGSASNYSFYDSQAVHDLLVAARVEPDQGKRAALYEKAQAQIAADVPMVPLVHTTQIKAFRKQVRGLRLHPTEHLDFRACWLAE